MSSTTTATQAGWYAVGRGRERYWDGSAWTERVRPVPAYVGVKRGDQRPLVSVARAVAAS